MLRTLRSSGSAIAFFCCIGVNSNVLPGQADAQQARLGTQFTAAQKSRLKEAGQLNQQVVRLHQQGKANEAIPLAEQVVAIRREILGTRHADTASALNNLGYMLYAMGKYEAAAPLLEQALAGWQAALGPQHAETATALNNLGLLWQALGEYERALPCFQEGLAIRKKALGEQNALTAISYNNLALLLEVQGEFTAARVNAERALAIRLKILGAKNAETATSYNNVGMLLYAQGDYAAARGYLERALAVRREILGDVHPEMAISLNNLGSLNLAEDKLDDARREYEQALAIWTKTLGQVHPRIADAMNNLGTVIQAQGDLPAARQQFEQSLAIRRQVMGTDHPDMASSLNNLGSIEWIEHDYVAARRWFERSLAIYQDAGGKDHPQTARSLLWLVDVDAMEGKWPAAADKADRARRIMRRHIVRVLPALAESEQVAFLKRNDLQSLQRCLSLGYQRRTDASIRALSAAWLLNGKAVAQEALAQQAVLLRNCKNPALASVVRELLQVRRQLATLTLTVVGPADVQARDEQLSRLERRERELSRRLTATESLREQTDAWIELAALRKHVPADAMLIDFARLNFVEYGKPEEGTRRRLSRYVAWIVPPTGADDIQIVDLGEAEEIENLIDVVRRGMQRIAHKGNDAQPGETRAEEVLRVDSVRLAQQILKPLLAAVGATRNLYLSPDGALWLLPWSALPLEDGRYAIEEYQFQYLVSGRDLVPPTGPRGRANSPIVMADPNYNLTPAEALAASRAVLGSAATNSSVNKAHIRGASSLAPVMRLPGTAVEAREIAPHLARYTQAKPMVYTDKYALEAVFKAVGQPRVLVLSTHGFFLPDQVVRPANSGEPVDNDLNLPSDRAQALENPLLRCGLLLAGCNQRAGATADSEDGVLTGMEIIGSDLRNSELVVLSACETGLGQVRNGEGVAGLRQAFQLAGADAVVATLWHIPDRESAQLMNEFFAELSEGESKPNALRLAQIAMIRQRRERFGAAHPYYWAAYTLTGR